MYIRMKIQDFYDIIIAEEKQAPQSGICFSAMINEQTSDEIGQRALKVRVCECRKINEQTSDGIGQRALKVRVCE